MGYTRILTVSTLLFSAAFAAGGTQDMCVGFSNGHGYNVNLLIEDLQPQSLSSICGNFRDTLHRNYKWCSPGPVQCKTNDDVRAVVIGVSTSDRDSGFSCVKAAFIETLQAPVIAGPIGIQCRDLDQGTGLKKRSRIEGPLEPRGIDTPSGRAQIGDQLTIASGQRLVLTALQFFAPDAREAIVPLVGGFFTQLVPNLANTLGAFGVAAQVAVSNLAPWHVVTSFDAGINNGANNVNANDWQNIIGTLSHSLQDNGGSIGVSCTFADIATNAVVMTVNMLIIRGQ